MVNQYWSFVFFVSLFLVGIHRMDESIQNKTKKKSRFLSIVVVVVEWCIDILIEIDNDGEIP